MRKKEKIGVKKGVATKRGRREGKKISRWT